MHSFVRRLMLAAVALPLLLGGCAEDEPDASPPDPPASPTSVSEPVEPTLPPEAEGTGPEAAEAFVRHYYATGDYAHATGDVTSLRTLGTEDCVACQRAADAIEAVYSDGGRIEGGTVTVEKTAIRRTRGEAGRRRPFTVTATVSNTDQTVSGSKEWDGKYPATTIRVRFQVVRIGDELLIAEWEQI